MGLLDPEIEEDDLDDDEREPAGVVPAAPSLPTPPASPVADNTDFLRQYLASRAMGKQRLDRAEETSEKDKLYARIAQAASTAAAGIARAPQMPDQTPFEGLAKDAQAPVTAVEKSITNQTANDRILRDYLTRQASVKQRADAAGLKDKKSQGWQGLRKQGIDEQRRHNLVMEAKLGAKDPNAGFTFRDAQLAKREHQKLMARIDRDPTLRGQLTQVTNMQNAMAAAENAVKEGKPITSQQMQEVQQSVLASLGVKGQQSVGEREKKMFDSVGMNGAAAVQFLTGKPQDIGKDNPLYQHVRDLARWESGNVTQQYQEQLGNLTAGQDWIYNENPNLKRDLEKKISTLTGHVKGRQFGAPDSAAPPAGASATPPAAPDPGKVRMIAPDGKTKLIPKDQVDAALKAGGRLAE